MDTHWCMEHLYELVISYCSAHSSYSVCQTMPLPYSQTVCLSLPLSLSLSPSAFLSFFVALFHTHTLRHTHTRKYTAQPTPQWVVRHYKYWKSGTVRVPAESTFHFAMHSSQYNYFPFSSTVEIALESLPVMYQKKGHNPFKASI